MDVEEYIPLKNHYSYKDDSIIWNEEKIHKAFINAGTIEVGGAERRMSTAIFARGFVATHTSLHQPSSSTNSHQVSVLKVAKVGLLNRKETTLDIGKRPKAGKWRLWSVVLTSSQLLFFRDQSWATSLQEQMNHRDGRVLVPPVPLLKPDEILSLKGSIALHDRSHDKVRSGLTPFLVIRLTFCSAAHFSSYRAIIDLTFFGRLSRRMQMPGFHASTTRARSSPQVSLCALLVYRERTLS